MTMTEKTDYARVAYTESGSDVEFRQHLLSDQSLSPSSHKQHRKQQIFHLVHIISLYCIIAILIIAVLTRFGSSEKCKDPSQGIYSPAQSAIEYETRVFDENFATKGPYMGSPENGLPTLETDKLWEDLYNTGVSRISEHETIGLPNKTTEIPNRPGEFVIELDVFHQLHCLNAIRKAMYPDMERCQDDFDDYFTKDGKRNYTSIAAKHFDHCIDSIRQSIMCHGDVATVYWQWMPKRRIPLPRLGITHTCRKFENIRQWAKEHVLESDCEVLEFVAGERNSFRLSP